MLEIVVHKISGYCPVYKVGDKIVINDPTLFLFYKKRKPVLKEKAKTSLKEKLYQKNSEAFLVKFFACKKVCL